MRTCTHSPPLQRFLQKGINHAASCQRCCTRMVLAWFVSCCNGPTGKGVMDREEAPGLARFEWATNSKFGTVLKFWLFEGLKGGRYVWTSWNFIQTHYDSGIHPFQTAAYGGADSHLPRTNVWEWSCSQGEVAINMALLREQSYVNSWRKAQQFWDFTWMERRKDERSPYSSAT